MWAADASGLSLRTAGVLGSAASGGGASHHHDPIEAEHAISAAQILGVSAFPALFILAASGRPGAAELPSGRIQLSAPMVLMRFCGGDALRLSLDQDGLLAALLSAADDGAAVRDANREAEAASAERERLEEEAVREEAAKVGRWLAKDFRLIVFGGAAGLEPFQPKQPVPGNGPDGGGGGGGGGGRGEDVLKMGLERYAAALLKALGAAGAAGAGGGRGPPRVALCSNQGGAAPSRSPAFGSAACVLPPEAPAASYRERLPHPEHAFLNPLSPLPHSLSCPSPLSPSGASLRNWMDKGRFGKPEELPHFEPLARAVASAGAAAAAALGAEYAAACGGVLVLSALAFQGQPKKRSAGTGELLPGAWAPLPGGAQRWERPVPPQWPAAGEAACCSSFDHSWRLPASAMLERAAAAAGVAASPPLPLPPPPSSGGAVGGPQPPESIQVLFVGSGQHDRDAAGAAGFAFCDAGKLLGGLRYHPEWPLREEAGAAERGGVAAAAAAVGGSGGYAAGAQPEGGAGSRSATSWRWRREWDEASGKPRYHRRPS